MSVNIPVMLGQCVSSFDPDVTEIAGVSEVQVHLAVPPSHGLVTQHLGAGQALVLAVHTSLVHRLQGCVQL